MVTELEIIIAVIAAVYVVFSVVVQRKLINYKRVYEVQEIIKNKSKELQDLTKNKASQELLMAKQKEITSLLGESMKLQFKPMLVILPVFFVMYYLLFPMVFPTNLSFTILSQTLGYKTYFIVIAFVLGLVISLSMMAYDKAKIAREKKLDEQQTSDPRIMP